MKNLNLLLSLVFILLLNQFAFASNIEMSGGRYNRITVKAYDVLHIRGDVDIYADDHLSTVYSNRNGQKPYNHRSGGDHGYIRVEPHGTLIIDGNLHIHNNDDEDDKSVVEGDLIVKGSMTIDYNTDDDEEMKFENRGTMIVAQDLNLNGARKLDDDDELLKFYNYGELLVSGDLHSSNHVQIKTSTSHHYHPHFFVVGDTKFEQSYGGSHHHDDDGWSVIQPHGHHYSSSFTHVGSINHAATTFMTRGNQVDNVEPLLTPHTLQLIHQYVSGIDLPVELTFFTAKVNNDEVTLQWETATEENVDHFELRRSYDGKHFELVADDIPAAGNSNTTLEYEFVDTDAHQGHITYELKEVDFDGKGETWKSIVELNSQNKISVAASISIYPVPADQKVNVDMPSSKEESVDFNLIFVGTGQIIPLRNKTIHEGDHHVLNVQDVHDGQYILNVIKNGHVIKRKHVIIHHS
ncbi:T9SS type A sorting domain-containing protein [Flammeovirga sp. OC4]|uniref:T9SS type A sorting domain-containing protein n=1 Tax=Flammeovirga sp. OC4 TaxID=1382345 RepID=UPI0005C4752F|nr:T9SS type A sorting domain-containing protein [Flammeovirga sp. OC4]